MVCLGSSCFARGNSENLALLKQHIHDHAPDGTLRLSGSLCQDRCKCGPNLIVDGLCHHRVTAERLRAILQKLSKDSTSESKEPGQHYGAA